MKEIKRLWSVLSHNFGLKLLALGSAFLIWIAVANTQDPMDFVTFNNVKVTTVNAEILKNRDKEPIVTENGTITVTVEARKSICDNLTIDDIIAVADFKKWAGNTETLPIDVSVRGYDDKQVEITRGKNEILEFTLSEYATKEFKVKLETTGQTLDGYVVGNMVASPNMISVYGPKLTISRIQSIVATVDVNYLAGDIVVDVRPVLYDNNDEEIAYADEKLTISSETVKVTTDVYRTKVVPIFATALGSPREGFETSGISSQPEQIVVAGTDADLAKLTNILADVDINGSHANVESNINIEELIDPKLTSIRIMDDDPVLAVTVYVNEQRKVALGLAKLDVTLANLADKFEIVSTKLSSEEVVVRVPSEIKNIDIRALAPSVDLSGIKAAGTYEIPIMFYEEKGIKVESWVTITIAVKEIPVIEPENEPVASGAEAN